MIGAYSLAGYFFGRNPTSSTTHGEENINVARNTAPWNAPDGMVENSDRNNYKYMYHPGGDYRNTPKRAPSALNSVVVPGVELPKVSPVSCTTIDKKDAQLASTFTRDSTSTERTTIRVGSLYMQSSSTLCFRVDLCIATPSIRQCMHVSIAKGSQTNEIVKSKKTKPCKSKCSKLRKLI